MEVIDPDKNQEEIMHVRPEKRRFVITGLLILAYGAAIFMDRTGNKLPDWVISWETILIVIGVYIGEKHHFRNPTFLIPILIGGIFLISEIYPQLSFRNYILPTILIIVGMVLILRPRRVWSWRDHHQKHAYRQRNWNREDIVIHSGEDYLDSVSIFGSTKKNIMSKNFKGGEATSFFGGTEINLMQADIQGEVVMELTQIFGGAKLIVPSHWEIKSELVNIFGGTEDKRPTFNITTDHTKVLIIKGTSVFGGIEIRSY